MSVGTGGWAKNLGYSDENTNKSSLNSEKSPGDQRRLAVIQNSVKKKLKITQLNLV